MASPMLEKVWLVKYRTSLQEVESSESLNPADIAVSARASPALFSGRSAGRALLDRRPFDRSRLSQGYHSVGGE